VANAEGAGEARAGPGGADPAGAEPGRAERERAERERARRADELNSRAADRLTAFADAVVAIAITLLALDLPVPTGSNVHQFWASAQADDPRYLAFLISFWSIAAAWSQHHDLFRYDRGTDGRMRTYHLAWLLMIILIPYATRLLTTTDHGNLVIHGLQWGFYSLVQAVESGALLLMAHRMTARGLLEPDTPPRVIAHATGQSYGTMLGFGLSVPVFFFTENGWVVWIVIPIFVRLIRARLHRRQAASAGAR
jgi:uncharacterized membrane protein